MGKIPKSDLAPDNVPLRVAYQCYFCLLGSTLLSLAIASFVLYDSVMDRYELIIENWKQQPISEIRVSYDKCQPDEEGLFNYNWPGTIDGCDCRGSRRVLFERRDLRSFYPSRKIYNDHSCNFTQEAYGCVSVYAKSPIDFRLFPDPSGNFGYELCVKREKSNNFYNSVPTSEVCPVNKIKCGSELDYFYCSTAASCPLFDIGVKGIKEVDNAIELPLKGNSILLYSRLKNGQLPIVDFRINEGQGVCVKNHDRGITVGRSEYPLMKENKTECDLDSRFHQIYKVNEEQFYSANSALFLRESLRGYVISSQYSWGIYQRSYIEWKMKCRGSQFHDFKEQEHILNDIYDQQVNLLIISIIFFVVISIIMSIISCANIMGYDWPCISGSGTQESNYIFYGEIFCKIVLQLTDAIIILISFSKVNDEIDFLDQLNKQNCSDASTHHDLNLIRDVLDQNVQQFNLGQLILFIITTVLDFIIASYLGVQYFKHRNSFGNSTQTIQQPNQEMQQYNQNDNYNQQFQQQQPPINEKPYFDKAQPDQPYQQNQLPANPYIYQQPGAQGIPQQASQQPGPFQGPEYQQQPYQQPIYQQPPYPQQQQAYNYPAN